MEIAIVGPGAIGSTFALHLAKAGHAVTVVARGARLAQLSKDHAVVTVDDQRADVIVHAALDVDLAYEFVIVSVLAHQVDVLLPVLKASKAKRFLFLFNTFEALDRLRDVVGVERFAIGLPGVVASFIDGKLKSQVVSRGARTTVSDERWGALFREAGIATDVVVDIHSFLRSHAALVVPFMVVSHAAYARKSGIPWREADRCAAAMKEGFDVVRDLGNVVVPRAVGVIARLPRPMLTLLLWTLSRTQLVQELGEQGPAEPRALIDAMTEAAPGRTPLLLAIRP